MVFRNESSYPEYVRLLKRNWGADTTGLRPETVTAAELLKSVDSQSAMIQQLVEELASFMGKSQDFSLTVPMTIILDGSRQGDTPDGVPDEDCGDGYATLLVQNISSEYDTDTGIVSNGHALIVKGVAAFETICAADLHIPGVDFSDLAHAKAIAFQLPIAGWGAGCEVLDYYDGDDPDPTSAGVEVYDPYALFPSYISEAKGKAVWNPDGSIAHTGPHWVAVECEESQTAGTGSSYTDGCGIDITGSKISINASQIAAFGLSPVGTCSLAVNYGCGLLIDAGSALAVDPDDLAGPGLKVTTSSDCQIEADIDCGLRFVNTTSGALQVKSEDLAGRGLTNGTETDCALDVDNGCGLMFDGDGKLAFNPHEVAGDGLTPSTASGACTLSVARAATASHIMFYLNADLSAGPIGTAAATIFEFWDGADPGTGAVVYDYHRDTTGYGPFIQAKGPKLNVREGAVGMAVWDDLDNHYKIVTCQTLAKTILFELTGSMPGTFEVPAEVTDYYDGQNPGTDLNYIFDKAELFRRGLVGATGYAILDDKELTADAGRDADYIIIECNQQASLIRGAAGGDAQCEATGSFNLTLSATMSKAPHGQPPTASPVPVVNTMGELVKTTNEVIAGWNEEQERYELIEIKNTEEQAAVYALDTDEEEMEITYNTALICVPVISISSGALGGVDCATSV